MRWLRNISLAIASAVAAVYAYTFVRLRRYERLDPAEADAPGTRFYVRGVGLHFVEAGDRANPAIVLIHGLGGSTFDYRRLIPMLAEYRYVLAVDLPGFGYSDRPASHNYALSSQARVVRELLERLDVTTATVVGHSMGGPIAMRLAIDAPGLVDRLILLAPATDERLQRRMPPLLARLVTPLMSAMLSHRPLRRLQMSTGVYDRSTLSDDLMDETERRSRMRGASRALASVIDGLAAEPPPNPAALVQPALVLWGESDRWLRPEDGDALVARMPNAEMRRIPNAGHLLVEEQPRLVAAAIRDFLGVRRNGAPVRKGRAAAQEPSEPAQAEVSQT